MIPKIVDHIVFAVPDLEEGIEYIHSHLGVRPVLGGSHKGFGTRNALLSLGRYAYLEILAPDPTQPENPQGRWMGVSKSMKPKLLTWASRTDNLVKVLDTVKKGDIQLGERIKMNRVTPSGDELYWEMTSPNLEFGDGLIPFYVNWINTPHPSQTLPFGGELVRLVSTHPNAIQVNEQLTKLKIELPVEQSGLVSLTAFIQTTGGIISLS